MSAYWYGAQQHLLDIADIFSERNIQIEAGPAKHGTTQAYFMYVFEPGGNRVELFGDTGYLIFDPDWQAVTWNVANEIDLVEKQHLVRRWAAPIILSLWHTCRSRGGTFSVSSANKSTFTTQLKITRVSAKDTLVKS